MRVSVCPCVTFVPTPDRRVVLELLPQRWVLCDDQIDGDHWITRAFNDLLEQRIFLHPHRSTAWTQTRAGKQASKHTLHHVRVVTQTCMSISGVISPSAWTKCVSRFFIRSLCSNASRSGMSFRPGRWAAVSSVRSTGSNAGMLAGCAQGRGSLFANQRISRKPDEYQYRTQFDRSN